MAISHLIEAIEDGDLQLVEQEVGMIEGAPDIGTIRAQILALELPKESKDHALDLIEQIK